MVPTVETTMTAARTRRIKTLLFMAPLFNVYGFTKLRGELHAICDFYPLRSVPSRGESTLPEAIVFHGGEGEQAPDAWGA